MPNTYSQSYASAQVTNDADFRARGKWFSDRLTDIGWAKTSDTGQINWATVTRPGAGNTVAGYEIRKSNDGLTDIYIKLEYGSAAAVTGIQFWITTGTGSDGAGALTGHVGTRVALLASTGAIACVDYVCGTTGRLMLAAGVVTAVNSIGFMAVLQRTTDASGVDTSTGFVLCTAYSSQNGRNQFTDFSTGINTIRVGLGWCLTGKLPYPATTAVVPVFPIYHAGVNDFMLMRDIVMVPTTYSAGSTVHTLSILGSNRTYISVFGNSGSLMEAATPDPLTACVRWE